MVSTLFFVTLDGVSQRIDRLSQRKKTFASWETIVIGLSKTQEVTPFESNESKAARVAADTLSTRPVPMKTR